jgi:hypothetical protein
MAQIEYAQDMRTCLAAPRSTHMARLRRLGSARKATATRFADR